MKIVALSGSTGDISVSPRPSLSTVCDDIVTAETFIHLYNHKGEEAVSPFVGAPPPHLDQSGRVGGTSFPLPSMPENMESTHMDYESQIFLIVKEVELGGSTHLLSWNQDSGNFNSSMGNDTGELDLQNESVTTDPLLGDVRFDPVATPEQHQFNGS